MTYTIDNDIDVLSAKTLKEANKKAKWLKRAHPLRMVYITKYVSGVNGSEANVISEQ